MKIVPEPDNPKDNQAIAFWCLLKGQWHTFGYVVTKLLEEVHGAIARHEIITTTFNPFLDVAGYIWHGHMRVLKKIQKILF